MSLGEGVYPITTRAQCTKGEPRVTEPYKVSCGNEPGRSGLLSISEVTGGSGI